MSVLVSWETPPELYNAAISATTATLTRRYGSDPLLPNMLVGTGITWGFYEDVDNVDPTSEYTVTYYKNLTAAPVFPHQRVKMPYEWPGPGPAPEHGPTVLFVPETPNPHSTSLRHRDGLKNAHTAGVIQNVDIRRWIRPPNTCRIDFQYTRPDSAPWSGRRIKLLGMPTHHYIRDLWTGQNGEAHIVLQWGAKLRLEPDGDAQALEFVVPHVAKIDAAELGRFGSLVRMDSRGVL